MKKPIQPFASFCCCAAVVVIMGCGQSAHRASSVENRLAATAEMDAEAISLVAGGILPDEASLDPANASRQARKIVYTSNIQLQVEEFSDFEPKLERLIRAHHGFAAERSTDRKHKDHRGGTWVIRVPVDQYDTFLSGMAALGFATSRSETADDVTEAYVDLQARMSNKRKLEQRVIAMLEEHVGKLSDVMEIERELARIREEIERMEGRLRVLMDQTSLATIHLKVTEKARYEPPTAPSVSDRVAAAWSGSILNIAATGAAVMIGLIAILPWLVLLAPVVLLGYHIRARMV